MNTQSSIEYRRYTGIKKRLIPEHLRNERMPRISVAVGCEILAKFPFEKALVDKWREEFLGIGLGSGGKWEEGWLFREFWWSRNNYW